MYYTINEKTYNVIIQRKRIKRLHIKLNNNNEIVVSCPYKTSDKLIEEVLKLRHNWLEKNLSKISQRIDELSIEECLRYQKIWYQGKLYNLSSEKRLSKPMIIGDTIYYQNSYNAQVYQKLISFYAKDIISFAQCEAFKQGYSDIEFSIRKMRRRWGSCNHKTRKIVLNKCLYALSEELLTFVIDHELTHLVVSNHSRNFYHQLALISPKHLKLRKELNKFGFLLDMN